MDERPGAQNCIAQEGLPSGQLIGEFKHTRAEVMRAMGLFFGLVGIALLGMGLLAGPQELRVFGVTAIVLDAGFFALGSLRKNNRLLVYADGLVQFRRGKAERHLWRDVQNVIVEKEWRYHNFGMYKTVRNYCSLQRKDGVRLQINAVPITSPVIKAIRQSCQGAGMGWQEGQQRWSL
jgi:hypothetical protein